MESVGIGTLNRRDLTLIGTVTHSTAYGMTFLLPLRIAEIGGDEAFVGLILVGVGFGAGWAVFYLLTPLLAINRASPEDRVKYLTIVSGLMMLGIGLGPVIGRALESVGLSVSVVFVIAAGLSLISGGLAPFLGGRVIATHGADTLLLALVVLGLVEWCLAGLGLARNRAHQDSSI